jgi:hypothetical protein
MTDIPAAAAARRVLEPVERIAEVLFGLIMVLTFTGSLSVADAGRADVRAMLVGALGCNLAWGIIDGIFCLMGCLAARGRAIATHRAVLAAGDPGEARRPVADAIPDVLARLLTAAEVESIEQRLRQLPPPAAHPRLDGDDWLGGLGVFLSTFPVAIPFRVMSAPGPALRVSNAVAVTMLFGLGCAYGRLTGYRPWPVGAGMVVIGAVLVALTIALGG